MDNNYKRDNIEPSVCEKLTCKNPMMRYLLFYVETKKFQIVDNYGEDLSRSWSLVKLKQREVCRHDNNIK